MIKKPVSVDSRPWYREPWPWVVIAIPLLTIIASAFTFYLAISHPDHLVIDATEYQKVKSQLQAEPTFGAETATDETDGGL